MCEPCTSDALLEAVRGLHVADPDLGLKPLLAKLREQQPDLGAGTREVREALNALKAESEAKAAVVPPAAKEQGAPSPAALSLACFGCARLPSDMDDNREKHPVCPKCRKYKVPTTYWCCVECPGNPGAWKLHAAYHKEVKTQPKKREDGGERLQEDREVAEEGARLAEQTGDKYDELLAEGARYRSKEDWRRAARALREAIALRPDEPEAYYNLGASLSTSGHYVEAVEWLLEAKERFPVDSKGWALATAGAFQMLTQMQCRQVAKPDWWNDDGLKVLSARVARAAPNELAPKQMRAMVLHGSRFTWKAVGPRSGAELKQAAALYERVAAMCNAPVQKAEFARDADLCRRRADAM